MLVCKPSVRCSEARDHRSQTTELPTSDDNLPTDVLRLCSFPYPRPRCKRESIPMAALRHGSTMDVRCTLPHGYYQGSRTPQSSMIIARSKVRYSHAVGSASLRFYCTKRTKWLTSPQQRVGIVANAGLSLSLCPLGMCNQYCNVCAIIKADDLVILG